MKYLKLFFDRELADYFRLGFHVHYPLNRKASIKDIIESQGVPHTEVGQIVVQGLPQDFSYIPGAGEHVLVRSIQPPFDVSSPNRLRPRSFSEIRFVVDVNAGKLAPLLRMLGYDTFFDHELGDEQIALLAHEQKRIVLSRDRALLKRGRIEFGRLIRSARPGDQLREVVIFFGLKPLNLFSRCLRCNHALRDVDKNQILHRLQPKTRKYYSRFSICPGCERIFWPGSHWEKMNSLMKNAGIVQ